ncbi:SH3 domain-containing protein [Friedmanniella luteola]|uniref:SH3 domain-containing protein n=1 Tax=Friedmanniella luteola TaxID=546871 RepID=UPI0012FD6504|nr:SH3 domain-containing protein [Friedmanniella luteola]
MDTRLSRAIAASAVTTALLFAGAAPLPTTAPTAAAATSASASASKATDGTARTTTANLNLRKGPGRSYGVIKVLRKGVRVTLTGRSSNGFARVQNANAIGWVSTKYLSTSKVSTRSAPAPRSSVTPRGLKPNAARTSNAAVAKFPRIKTVYGVRPGGGDHATGRAVDLMIPAYRSTSGKQLGGKVAAWARTNAKTLGITYVIWNQHIWSARRSSEGWRAMANRGGDSANHKNHVHISVK